MVGIDRYFPTDSGGSAHASMLSNAGGPTRLLLRHLPTDPAQGITRLALIYLVALVSAYLFEFIQTYLMQWTGQKIMFDCAATSSATCSACTSASFDNHAVGRLVTRLTSDVDAINEMFTGGILAIVDDFFTLTIMAIVMLSINWWLALLAFAVLPVILFVTRAVPQQRARELSPGPRSHRAHQQLHAGTRQRHERGAALQPRRARVQRLRGGQSPAHDRLQRHDLRLRALLPRG